MSNNSNKNETTTTTSKVIISIDIGSSSIRCSAYSVQKDDKIELISNTNNSHTMTVVEPISGLIHINDIIKYVDECIDKTLHSICSEQNDDNIEIVGVGISTFVGNLIGVNKNGNIINNNGASAGAMISYACCNTNVVNDGYQLRKSMNDDEFNKLYQKTGTYFLHSSYALLQLRNYYNNISNDEDGNDDNVVYKWQSVASILLSHWISISSSSSSSSNNNNNSSSKIILPISYSEASWTGIFNYKTCKWCDEDDIFNDILLPKYVKDTLPNVEDISYTITLDYNDNDNDNNNSHWKYKYKKYIQNVPFYLGIGDGICANIGSKSTNLSRIAITIGTSAAVRICYPLPIISKDNHDNDDDNDITTTSSNIQIPHGLFAYRINKQYILIGGALTDGGSIIQWIQSLLNMQHDNTNTFEILMKQVQEYYSNQLFLDNNYENNNKNLIFLPFLSGERSTNYNNKALGGIIGINRYTSSNDILYICLQGVVLRIYAIIKLLLLLIEEHNNNDNSNSSANDNTNIVIIASGKALEKNNLWRQMISDCTSINIIIDEDACVEGTSRGIVRIIQQQQQQYQNNDNDSFFSNEEILNDISNSIPCDNNDMKQYWMNAFYRQEKVIDCMKNAFD